VIHHQGSLLLYSAGLGIGRFPAAGTAAARRSCQP